MSYILVKLDSPSLKDGPATVLETDHQTADHQTLRVGEAFWLDDCRDRLIKGDRVAFGTVAVRRLGGAA